MKSFWRLDVRTMDATYPIIFVEDELGITYRIPFEESDTVEDLKIKVYERTALAPKHIVLTFGGKVLVRNSEYDISVRLHCFTPRKTTELFHHME